ncbi:hypothetical protein B0H67DRAFT_551276 [Lasiosphaeris hirsuta]|uniref:Uncharacterized protein n=1 Tax=Lasiosphaeris hirsuta TaxID=260670 RepID=A0AA40E2Q7_9PEZI|nr:hypothetical protein B0H67DRAFT_551276 [Lasiosphaeris hirsuta]
MAALIPSAPSASSTPPTPSTRPFWLGLDPDKPEPLDKVLAALYCFQVAPPSADDASHFEFTVNRGDHRRIEGGFPELQNLAIGRDPLRLYYLMRRGLESLGQLDKPVGPLALGIQTSNYPNVIAPRRAIAFGRAGKNTTSPTCLVVFFNGDHEGASKYAQLIAKHPNEVQTVMQRLAQNSFVSVFTMVDGAIKTVVQQEPLSTPGGEIKLWLSDLIKDHEGLSDEFTRPRVEASRQPNIAVPYAAILASANKQ